jgi:hypothetical protein
MDFSCTRVGGSLMGELAQKGNYGQTRATFTCTYVTIYAIQYTGIFLPSRDFLQEQQSYLLTGSPLSKNEGGQSLSPLYIMPIKWR